METLTNSQTEYEFIVRDIINTTPNWSALRKRVERSERLDSALNAQYELHNGRMDFLLESLHDKMIELEAPHD